MTKQEAATAFAIALINLIEAVPATTAEATTTTPTTKTTRTKKAETSATEPTPAAAPAAEEPKVTAKQVADAILQLAADKGRDAAVGVLAKFKAQRVSDLKPAQYQDALKAATDAMVVDEAPAATDSLV